MSLICFSKLLKGWIRMSKENSLNSIEIIFIDFVGWVYDTKGLFISNLTNKQVVQFIDEYCKERSDSDE